ncbi:lipid-binding SYLF domain-containing protein [Hyphococcus flavus]|uniref:Lipid-binding SYLF domain-containing protein n=1 Tax=Hyphococcus flavus TaxID=1866326 RepID=A0AAE9ZDR7_9PROT|nr:lipid-binding SYLF domain-containing protein [Hyphococcus flavus]WDI33144.1 lipid-binding SYLF domain-containing protein [Hyphococcus flavus]
MTRLIGIIGAAFAAFTMALGPAAAKSKQEKAEELIIDAADTVSYFANDSAYEPLWDAADNAKAMVIIPKSLRGGFIIGASGGNAVMVARNDDGSWSEPTFFTVGSLSIGFQAGFEGSETILLVMTQRGMEHLLSTTVKLGADLSLAAGPIGAGAKAQTVDVLAFSRSRGLYGGVSLEGAILKSRGSWNEGYYQANVTPADIIYREKVSRPQSAVLQNAVWALAHRDQPAMMAPLRPAKTDPVTGEPLPEEPVYEDDAIYGAPLDPIESD